jgi:imidazolonepropionase-like amidohydrolase
MTRSGFKTMDREGEAPAEPRFHAFSARREPPPPGFQIPSTNRWPASLARDEWGRRIGRTVTCSAIVFVMLVASRTGAEPPTTESHVVALVGGTLHTVVDDPIPNGVLLIRDGRFEAVGADIAIPEDAEQIDLSGKHVYPGLIDSDTALGLIEIEAVRATRDTSEVGLINSNVQAIVAFNPDSELIPVAKADGVLIAHSVPRGGLISGQSAVVALDGWNAEDMAIVRSAGMHVNWPRSSARRRWFSEESAKEQMDARKKRLWRLKDELESARAFRAARVADATVPFDPRLDALARVSDDGLPLFVHADDVRQIQESVAFAQREHLKLVIVGGYDAMECAELLKKYDVPVIVTGTHRLPRRRNSPYDEPYTLPARLKQAGVRFCIAGYDRFSASAVRNLPQHAGTAVAHGLSQEDALRAITLSAAEILGIADRVGSLQPGKDATIIVTEEDVLEIASRVGRAWIAGREVDLDSRHKRLYRKYRAKYGQSDAGS